MRKRKVIKIILALVMVASFGVGMYAFSIDVLAEDENIHINTSAKKGHYSRHDTMDTFYFKIKAKKASIITVDYSCNTELWSLGSPIYGFSFGSFETSENFYYRYDTNPGVMTQYSRRVFKKRLKTYVGQGETFDIDIYGGHFSFNLNYSLKPYKMKKTKIKTLNKKSNKIHVAWKKVKKIKGYEIQISTNKKFKKDTYQKKTKKTKLNAKLKKRKKYYIRVRTYKKAFGREVASDWSKKRSIKL